MPRTITVIGTGRMGYPLVLRLLERGHNVKVYNRTYEKAAQLSDQGAEVYREIGPALKDVELIIVALSSADAAKSLFEQIPGSQELASRALMVLSTTSSAQALALQEWANNAGMIYLETPVMGGPDQVLDGSLTMIVGADELNWKEWQSFFNELSQGVYWTGPVGSASALKLALNQFMASAVASLSTSVALVQAAEIPVETLMEILKRFPYFTPSFNSKLPLMLEGQYENPKFTIDMMGKDVRLMVDEARRRGIYAETLQAISDLYKSSAEAGMGEKDYSAIFEQVRSES